MATGSLVGVRPGKLAIIAVLILCFLARAPRVGSADESTPEKLEIHIDFTHPNEFFKWTVLNVKITNKSKDPVRLYKVSPGRGLEAVAVDQDHKLMDLWRQNDEPPNPTKHEFFSIQPGEVHADKFAFKEACNFQPKEGARVTFSVKYSVQWIVDYVYGKTIPPDVVNEEFESNKLNLLFTHDRVKVLSPQETLKKR